MGRFRLVLCCLTLSLTALSALAAPKQSQIYLDLSEDWQPHAGQFKQILLESFKRLSSWQTQAAILEAQGKTIEEIRQANSNAKIDGILVAKLSNTTQKGEGWFADDEEKTAVQISLYDKATGNLILEVQQNLPRTQPSALFANLESELPLTLKIKLAEVGSIIKKSSELVYFNLGNTAGIQAGQIFRTFKPGDKLINKQGEVFGWIEKTTGIVRITHSQSTYSTAEILLGRLSISENDFIELASEQDEKQYAGKIISVHENKVAINLGDTVGVADGANYAVFKDIKTIKDQESFREKLGDIRIQSVYEDYAVGELSLSNHYNLSKALIKEGDPVEEIKPVSMDLISFGQMGTNALSSSSSDNILMAGYQTQSEQVSGMLFRYRGGYGSDVMLSAGVMTSINHSPNFFYGLDAVYLDGVGANFFLSVDVPTPIDGVNINMETGYMAGVGDSYEGFNLNISVKYPFDQLF